MNFCLSLRTKKIFGVKNQYFYSILSFFLLTEKVFSVVVEFCRFETKDKQQKNIFLLL